MENKKGIIILIIAAVLMITAYQSIEPLAEDKAKVNVILISVDTLRLDHLGCYGYPRETSPNIDLFAGENIQFNQHITPMPTTLPAHTSMFTGLYPIAHGVRRNGLVIDDSLKTLAEILKERGYKTASFANGKVMGDYTNLYQGFDEYYGNFSQPHGIKDLVEKAQNWIDTQKGEEKFLFLHAYNPHNPYNPPKEYLKWVGYDGLDGVSIASTRGKKYDERVEGYDGEILYTDEALGGFLDFLRKNGYFNDSIIIFTSDHGESLGQHDYLLHGAVIYDSTVRVPLIIHLPGSPPEHSDVWTQSSHVDIMPTVLDILGIKSHEALDGISLFSDEIKDRLGVYIERRNYNNEIEENLFQRGRFFSVRTPQAKYIYKNQYPEEFYDLSTDPTESENRISTDVNSADELRQNLFTWINKTEPKQDAKDVADEEVIAALEDLGYIS